MQNGRRVKPRLSVLGGGGRPSLDYDDYETDESGNLVFYSAEQGSAGASASKPDSSLKGLLSEFVQLLKKTNETAGGDGVEVVKRLFKYCSLHLFIVDPKRSKCLSSVALILLFYSKNQDTTAPTLTIASLALKSIDDKKTRSYF